LYLLDVIGNQSYNGYMMDIFHDIGNAVNFTTKHIMPADGQYGIGKHLKSNGHYIKVELRINDLPYIFLQMVHFDGMALLAC